MKANVTLSSISVAPFDAFVRDDVAFPLLSLQNTLVFFIHLPLEGTIYLIFGAEMLRCQKTLKYVVFSTKTQKMAPNDVRGDSNYPAAAIRTILLQPHLHNSRCST